MNKRQEKIFFATKDNGVFFLCSRRRNGKTFLGLQDSSDGNKFVEVGGDIEINSLSDEFEFGDCKDFSVTKFEDEYFLYFKKKEGRSSKLYVAISDNGLNWNLLGKVEGIKSSGVVVPDFFYDNDMAMYIADGKGIKIAYSENLVDWDIEKKWIIEPRKDKFDNNKILPAGVFEKNDEIVMLYYHLDKEGKYSIGAVKLMYDNPEKVIWRSEHAIWKQGREDNIEPLSIVDLDDELISYWETKTGEIVSMVLPHVYEGQRTMSISLDRACANPIMSPQGKNDWEALAAFNPTVFEHEGQAHILYRAMGHDALSTVGYAISRDGINIDKRFEQPIYVPREEFEGGCGVVFDEEKTPQFMSGGGWGGCEDARVTIIDDKAYIMYAAFNGKNEPEVAISSIDFDDFMNREWNNWKKPVLVTNSHLSTKNPEAVKWTMADRPGYEHTGEKDAAILPEKIDGKYVVFHRIWPNIVIDFVDDLDFDGENFLCGEHMIQIRPDEWDSFKLCLAATPLKTDEGWLLIYNAVDKKDPSKYKLGAMMLDLKDPRKVLYRCKQPILEPEEHYENGGLKYGIVFACGAMIKDGVLYVYYGGSDQHSCVATHDLESFLEKLKAEGDVELKKVI